MLLPEKIDASNKRVRQLQCIISEEVLITLFLKIWLLRQTLQGDLVSQPHIKHNFGSSFEQNIPKIMRW